MSSAVGDVVAGDQASVAPLSRGGGEGSGVPEDAGEGAGE